MPRAKKPAAPAPPAPKPAAARHVFDPERLIEDLQQGLRGVRLERLGDVMLALERASGSRAEVRDPEEIAEAIARRVVALGTSGSKLDAIQRAVVMQALSECDGNLSAAARLLGMERKALERKVARFKNGG